jgi:hypothetical protein
MLYKSTVTENCYKAVPEPKQCAMKVDRGNEGKSAHILNFDTKQRLMFSTLQPLICRKRVPRSYWTEARWVSETAWVWQEIKNSALSRN